MTNLQIHATIVSPNAALRHKLDWMIEGSCYDGSMAVFQTMRGSRSMPESEIAHIINDLGGQANRSNSSQANRQTLTEFTIKQR